MNNISRLPSAGPLNLPLGVVSGPSTIQRMSAVEPNALEQLADLRVELVALRSLLDVGLELLSSGVPLQDVARFLQTGADAERRHRNPFNVETICRCDLHRRAA